MADQDRTDLPGDHEQHPGQGDRDAETAERAAAVGGQQHRADRGEQGDHSEHDRGQAGARGDSHEHRPDPGDVASEQLDVVAHPELVRQRRSHQVEPRGGERPGIGQGQRHRVLIAVDRRAVQVPNPGAEQVRERPAADRGRDGALDQGTRRQQLAGVADDQVVGDPPCDEGPHRRRPQRVRRPVGELVGAGGDVVDVSGCKRQDEREPGDRTEHPRQPRVPAAGRPRRAGPGRRAHSGRPPSSRRSMAAATASGSLLVTSMTTTPASLRIQVSWRRA